MKLGHVDHITLNVTDIEAATEAFKQLGMEVEGSVRTQRSTPKIPNIHRYGDSNP